MGFFDRFSKGKKETLDKGLEKTKENFFSKITRAVAGKSKVDDDVLDQLEEVLVTSDVGVETTLKVIERIEERVARDKYVSTDELTAILRDEIEYEPPLGPIGALAAPIFIEPKIAKMFDYRHEVTRKWCEEEA